MSRAAPPLIALAVAYVALTRESFAWLGQALAAPAARGSLIVIVVLLGAVIWRIGSLRLAASVNALSLLIAAALTYIGARAALPWHRLHVVIALVGLYGLIGCVVPGPLWRRGCAALALVVVALPFGEQLDVLAGYPLRLLSTGSAQVLLEQLGVRGTSRATLLVFESGAAQIDVPCSGIKSLWAGALLALGAPLVLAKRFDTRWALATVGVGVALVVGNTLRIVALVMVAIPARQPAVAEILHRPLGCVGFVATAAAYIAFLLRGRDTTSTPWRERAVRPSRVYAAAAAVAMAVGVAPAHARQDVVDERAFVVLPPTLVTSAVALSSTERAFFSRQGADHAYKVRFTWGEVRGSLILVRSAHAAAQHPPEQCLTSAGHEIRSARTAMLAGNVSVRVLALAHGCAVNWFQSGHESQGDYAARVWAGGTWVQVSILFDDVSADDVPMELVRALYEAIATQQGDADAAAEARE